MARELAGVVDGSEDVLEEMEEREERGIESEAVVVLRESVEADADSEGASEEEGLEGGCAVASLLKLGSEPGKLRKEGVVHCLLVLCDERRELVFKCRRHLLLLVACCWFLVKEKKKKKNENKNTKERTKRRKKEWRMLGVRRLQRRKK